MPIDINRLWEKAVKENKISLYKECYSEIEKSKASYLTFFYKEFIEVMLNIATNTKLFKIKQDKDLRSFEEEKNTLYEENNDSLFLQYVDKYFEVFQKTTDNGLFQSKGPKTILEDFVEKQDNIIFKLRKNIQKLENIKNVLLVYFEKGKAKKEYIDFRIDKVDNLINTIHKQIIDYNKTFVYDLTYICKNAIKITELDYEKNKENQELSKKVVFDYVSSLFLSEEILYDKFEKLWKDKEAFDYDFKIRLLEQIIVVMTRLSSKLYYKNEDGKMERYIFSFPETELGRDVISKYKIVSLELKKLISEQ